MLVESFNAVDLNCEQNRLISSVDDSLRFSTVGKLGSSEQCKGWQHSSSDLHCHQNNKQENEFDKDCRYFVHIM